MSIARRKGPASGVREASAASELSSAARCRRRWGRPRAACCEALRWATSLASEGGVARPMVGAWVGSDTTVPGLALRWRRRNEEWEGA